MFIFMMCYIRRRNLRLEEKQPKKVFVQTKDSREVTYYFWSKLRKTIGSLPYRSKM